MSYDMTKESDELIGLRLANRAERFVRLLSVEAPEAIVDGERKLLSQAAAEWLRRYPEEP